MNSNIYYFNPTCEQAVANGTVAWRPNRLLLQFENDLALLPSYFAKPHDFVIALEFPKNNFLPQFEPLEWSFPNVVTMEQIHEAAVSEKQRFNELKPWGQSMVVHHKFRDLKTYFSTDFRESITGKWNPKLKDFYSRLFAKHILSHFFKNNPQPYFAPETCTPQICYQTSQAAEWHKKWEQSVFKMALSASGRGIQMVRYSYLHTSITDRLQGMLNKQGCFMAEPMLDRKLDFATQFGIKNGIVTFIGLSVFDTDKEGQYQGNVLNINNRKYTEPTLDLLTDRLNTISEGLTKTLQNSDLPNNYEGILGIDGMVYKHNGKLLIQPCLEINLRYNMGALALELDKLLCINSFGNYRQFMGKAGDFTAFIESQSKPNFKNGRIKSGVLSLTPQSQTTRFGAYIEIFDKHE